MTRHFVGAFNSSQSFVAPPRPTGPLSKAFGSWASRGGFGRGGARFLTIASTGAASGGGSTAGVSVGVGGGGSIGGGGDAGGGGAPTGGLGVSCPAVSTRSASGSSAGGGGVRAACPSRFCRRRRANLSQARQQRWTSTTTHGSVAPIAAVGQPYVASIMSLASKPWRTFMKSGLCIHSTCILQFAQLSQSLPRTHTAWEFVFKPKTGFRRVSRSSTARVFIVLS